jgi:hypothetical protein
MWRKQLLLNVPKGAAAHACILTVRQNSLLLSVNTKQQQLKELLQNVLVKVFLIIIGRIKHYSDRERCHLMWHKEMLRKKQWLRKV